MLNIGWYAVGDVAPHVGAWIEIYILYRHYYLLNVAPHVGAWIEITKLADEWEATDVAPQVGAWKEMIINVGLADRGGASHPMWVRGLKLSSPTPTHSARSGRTPCGCVD